MAVTKIPMSSLVVNREWNTRKSYKGIEELSQNIAINGLLIPPIVEKDGEKYILRAGFRRSLALELLFKEHPKKMHPQVEEMLKTGLVPVDVQGYENEQEAFMVNLVENAARDDLSTYDKASAFVRAQKEMNFTPATLSNRMAGIAGQSRQNITNWSLIFERLKNEDVINAWKNGDSRCTIDNLREVAKYETEKEQGFAWRRLNLINQGMSVEDADKQAAEEEGLTEAPAPVASRASKNNDEGPKSTPQSKKAIENMLLWLKTEAKEYDEDRVSFDCAMAALRWVLGYSATGGKGDTTTFKIKLSPPNGWCAMTPEVKEDKE